MIADERVKCCGAVPIGDDTPGSDLLSPFKLHPPGLSFFNYDLRYKGIKRNLSAVRLILSEKKLGQDLYAVVFDVIEVPLYGPEDWTCTVKDRAALAGTKAEEVF
jgi:hypothetical protein